jgi:prepilin signal peptidase PulO-like enzyme (type II secretory pathway)
MTIIIFFILGLIIGSFLNVVVYRLNLAESVLGRSHCPNCKAQVRWYDNIPLLSFIALGAKCRDCGEKISWQYPLVEFFTGIVFALVGNYFFISFYPLSWLDTVFYLGVFSALLIIFAYDLKYMEIPMIIIWLASGWAVIYLLLFDWLNYGFQVNILNFRTFSGILGAVIAFLLFFIISSVSKEKWMGMGDAYLALLCGLVVSFPNIALAMTLAFAIGAVVGIVLVVLGKKKMQSQIPFAPFFVSAVIITIIAQRAFPVLDYFWI